MLPGLQEKRTATSNDRPLRDSTKLQNFPSTQLMRTTSRIIGAMEICNGAFDTITGHGRSASAGAIRAAPTAPVVVQVVPGGGGTQAVTTEGHVVCTTG